MFLFIWIEYTLLINGILRNFVSEPVRVRLFERGVYTILESKQGHSISGTTPSKDLMLFSSIKDPFSSTCWMKSSKCKRKRIATLTYKISTSITKITIWISSIPMSIHL